MRDLVQRRRLIVFALGGVAGALFSVGRMKLASLTREPAPPAKGALLPFSLTDTAGATVTLSELRGKVWAGYFFFTSCHFTCPPMTLRAASLTRHLGDERDFRTVAFTIDPAHDTPAVLAQFARTAHADPERWWFLTGSVAQMKALGEDSLHVGFNPPHDGMHGGHASLFALIDRDGRIRGYYRSDDDAEMAKLEKDARAVLDEPQGAGG